MKKRILTIFSLVLVLACGITMVFAACNDPNAHTEHVWDNGVEQQAPTCYAEGKTLYTCTVKGCGKTKIEPIATSEHSWDDGVQTKDPSCTEEGETTYTCTVTECKATTTEPIDKIPHAWGDWSSSATQPGKEERVCGVCKDVDYRDPQIISCTHENVEPHEAKTPTCIEGGNVAYWYCADCQKYFADDDGELGEVITQAQTQIGVDANNHVYGESDWVKPTVGDDCLTAGVVGHYECECGKWLDADGVEIPEGDAREGEYGPHDYTKYVVGDATHTLTCSLCDEADPDHTDEAHDFNHNQDEHECVCGKLDPSVCTHAERTEVMASPATCTDDEVIGHWTCDKCGLRFETQTSDEILDDTYFQNATPATGHSWKLAATDWSWDYTDGTKAILHLVCDNEDCNQTNDIEFTTEIDKSTTDATCTAGSVTNCSITVSKNDVAAKAGFKLTEKDHWADEVVAETFTSNDTVNGDPLGHTSGEWQEASKGLDCQTRGTVGHSVCETCGMWLDGQNEEIPEGEARLGEYGDHKWNGGQMTKVPDIRTAGEMTYTCTVDECGQTRTDPIDPRANYREQFSTNQQGNWKYGHSTEITNWADDNFGFNFEEFTNKNDAAWLGDKFEIKADWILTEGSGDAVIQYVFGITGKVRVNFDFFGDEGYDEDSNLHICDIAIRVVLTHNGVNKVIEFVGPGRNLNYDGLVDVEEGDTLSIIFFREGNQGWWHGGFNITITDETPATDDQTATETAYIDVTKQNDYEQI